MFNSKYSKILTVILIVVIIGIVGTVGYFVYDIYAVKAKNNKAQEIIDQFSQTAIRREFDEKEDQNAGNTDNPLDSINSLENEKKEAANKTYMEGYEVMGMIEISKTGIKYPVLSEVTKKSLETSVAILYRNGLFFSDNKKLAKGDTIKITDQTGTTITYEIYEMFETSPSDAGYMQRDTAGAKEISLSTCTDDSSARLIILAREK